MEPVFRAERPILLYIKTWRSECRDPRVLILRTTKTTLKIYLIEKVFYSLDEYYQFQRLWFSFILFISCIYFIYFIYFILFTLLLGLYIFYDYN
jgi:hypothetical protein